MVLIYWFNPKDSSIYCRISNNFTKIICSPGVGTENSYGHYIISILIFYKDKFIPADSYLDILRGNSKLLGKGKRNAVLIDCLIGRLEKLKNGRN